MRGCAFNYGFASVFKTVELIKKVKNNNNNHFLNYLDTFIISSRFYLNKTKWEFKIRNHPESLC